MGTEDKLYETFGKKFTEDIYTLARERRKSPSGLIEEMIDALTEVEDEKLRKLKE